MELLRNTVRADGPVELEERWEDGRYTLRLRNPGDAPAELEALSALFSCDCAGADAFFLNGFQSWTYSPERTRKQYDAAMRFVPGALDRKFGLSQYGDGYFSDPLRRREQRRGCKKGYSYAYLRRGKRFSLLASLAEDTGFTGIEINPAENSVLFRKDCRGRVLQPGEEYTGLDLIFPEGEENAVFDAWFEALGLRALPAEPKIGYTSWYNCYQNISEAQILRDLEGMKALPVKPDIFQIDDGFEPFVGDWLAVDQLKFPNGLEPIVQKIRDEGYQAGI